MKASKGFAHPILLLILITAIVIGVLLIKNGTNILPKASEEDAVRISTVASLTGQLRSKIQSKSQDPSLKDVTSKRKVELNKLAISDPASFLQQATIIGQDANLPDNLVGDIEKQVEVQGVLTAIHGDDLNSKKVGPTEYYINQPQIKNTSGKLSKPRFYRVNFVKPPKPNVIGAVVTVNGIAIDTNLVVDTGDRSDRRFNLRVEDKKVLGVTNPIAGDQKIAVILVKFTNDLNEPVTKDQVKNMMFLNPDSVDAYFRQTSYNKASFSGDVFGWWTLPYSGENCETYKWGLDADALAIQNGIDLSPYKYRMYVFPSNTACFYGGLGELGFAGSTTLHSWIFLPSIVGVYKHELGHNLGVHHASSLFCDGASTDYHNCSLQEYGDITDTMGDAYGGAQFNGPHKAALGWIASGNIIDVPTTGPQTYSIYNTETQTSLPQIVKSKTIYNNFGSDYYYFSYRQPLGFDSILNPEITNGASVHLWNENPLWQTRLIDTNFVIEKGFFGINDASLKDGQIFTDPNTLITVRQISHDNSKAVIQVDQKPLPQGSITSNVPFCNIPIGQTNCMITITWTTQNATDVKVRNKGSGQIVAIGSSGSLNVPIETFTTLELLNGSGVLGSLDLYSVSLPDAPIVKVNVSCITENYAADGVAIRWVNSVSPVYFVGISKSSDQTVQFGSKYVDSLTETTAPNGFYFYTRYEEDNAPLTLNPDTTYYVFLTNGYGAGPSATFSIPRCQNQTPNPTPSPFPTPTPKGTPPPTPMPSTACNPRPNIGRSTQMTPDGLVVNLSSGTNPTTPQNPMALIHFTGLANATVTLDGKLHKEAFEYKPLNKDAVSFLIKQVTFGQSTNVSLSVYDSCGPYSLFFGGGTGANWPKI